jgi:cell division protein FtsZ
MMNPDEIIAPTRQLTVKIIAVGSAGCNAVEHMNRTDLAPLGLSAVHTNARVLQSRNIRTKLLIGVNKTHGLGTGGDPDFARVMAETEFEQMKELCKDADLLFIVAGLGGGTGTGVSPVLARAAKESGALVLAVVTMPFEFEGPRRSRQAMGGLQLLKASADAVICLPNQKVAKIINDRTSVLEAFGYTNELMAQGVRGIWQMLTRPGLINVDFAYLYSVLRGRHVESSFATAEASGDNRAMEVVEKLASNPLLDNGQALNDAENILVSIVGGSDLSIADVNTVMEQINRRTDSTQIVMGAGIDEHAAGKIYVTVIASKNGKPSSAVGEVATRSIMPAGEIDTSFFEQSSAPVPRPPSRFKAPPPPSTPEKTQELFEKQSAARARKGASKLKQGLLALEIISRGRFEKSEPTVHQGADLDVPTFIRRGMPLN